MLTNSLYLKEQLFKEDIEEYLRRILILIRRDEIRRIKEKTISKYERSNENNLLETTWEHERDSIKLDEFNKKKRKYFKCKRVNYIRWFCRNKEGFSKEKKDIFTVFEKS